MENKTKNSIIIGCILALLLLLPLVIKTDYIINFLILVYLYVVITQSWNIMGGYAGQVNIGQSAFFGMGALVTRMIWVSGVPIYIAMVAGGLSSLVLAAFIIMPALRLRGAYFAIGTLALAVIIRITIGNILPDLSFLPGKYLAEYTLAPRYYTSLGLMVVAIVVIYLIVNSRLGLGMVAIREEEDAAGASGVNTFRYKIIALSVSSFFAGMAGGIYAYYQASYYPYTPFGLLWAFEPILITFIGGMGTILGPTIGAVGYVVLKELFAITLGEVSVIVFGTLFILVVLFLPGGLIEASTKVLRLLARFSKGSQTL
jgi:branched-chain amino acid transport system permease protein